jgi:hypothetical protein
MEVVQLVVVQIMGFVEDERNFLTVTFLKTWLQNMICEHLWTWFGFGGFVYLQPFYIMDSFPYDNAIMAWIEEKTWKGLLVWELVVACIFNVIH